MLCLSVDAYIALKRAEPKLDKALNSFKFITPSWMSKFPLNCFKSMSANVMLLLRKATLASMFRGTTNAAIAESAVAVSVMTCCSMLSTDNNSSSEPSVLRPTALLE